MDTNDLIDLLEETATLSELAGENPFKSRAFAAAARNIESAGVDIFEAVKFNKLHTIPGIGPTIKTAILEFVESGSVSEHEKLKSEVPPGLLDMTKIPGLGPKKVRAIFLSLGIKTLGELERAARDNEIAGLKGFGEKSQNSILQGIEGLRANQGWFHQHIALLSAQQVASAAEKFVSRIELSGELRRRTEVVRDIYFVAIAKDEDKFPGQLRESFSFSHSAVKQDGRKFLFTSEYGIPVTIELSDADNFAARLFLTTGSEEFIGAFPGKDNMAADEKEIFKLAKLPFIEPELRESAEVLSLKKSPKLVELADMKAMLHVHSTWSDGKNSIREMALGAKELGYEYIAICDHSRAAAYAGGLSVERVLAQHEEIEELNKEKLGIPILKGIESDILPDGSLDYPDEILAQFDIVVASVHSSFKMSEEDMTARIIRALENPYTTILGHPTGRLLLKRKGYELDQAKIIDAAIANGKIIEINANPYRFDLAWEWARYGKERGLLLAINPDAHSVEALTQNYLGVGIARKAGLEPDNIVNTYTLERFRKTVKKN